VLVADEPTSRWNVSVQSTILETHRAAVRAVQASVLPSPTTCAIVHEICDEVSVIHHGEIVETGPTRRSSPIPPRLHAAADRRDPAAAQGGSLMTDSLLDRPMAGFPDVRRDQVGARPLLDTHTSSCSRASHRRPGGGGARSRPAPAARR